MPSEPACPGAACPLRPQLSWQQVPAVSWARGETRTSGHGCCVQSVTWPCLSSQLKQWCGVLGWVEQRPCSLQPRGRCGSLPPLPGPNTATTTTGHSTTTRTPHPSAGLGRAVTSTKPLHLHGTGHIHENDWIGILHRGRWPVQCCVANSTNTLVALIY